MQIDIVGSEQRLVLSYKIKVQDMGKTLLDILREQMLPIASSCSGIGICRKCLCNEDILSCKVIISKDLKITTFHFPYL